MKHNTNTQKLRPFEKYEKTGVESLTDDELLALILRSGTKAHPIEQIIRELFSKNAFVQYGLKGLFYLSKEQIFEISGIGSIKTSQLLAIVELAKRIHKVSYEEVFSFNSPEQTYNHFRESFLYLKKEEAVVVYLNSKLRMIKEEILTVGTSDMCLISPRDVFMSALNCNATHIILMHNHPSGDPKPGSADINVTKTLEKAGKMLNISLIDHIIMGEYRYYSMYEHGILGGQ